MKLYLVTRQDLSPGAQAAQLCHAMREWTEHHKELDRSWYEASNTLVLLTAKDEGALSHLLRKAQKHGVATAAFHEPDLDDALTAIAIAPEGARFCRNLPLALSKSS